MSAQGNSALINDAEALDALAAGAAPDRLQVLVRTLNTLRMRGTSGRELIDAAAGLDALATGPKLEFKEEGARAAKLAERARRELPPLS